MPADREGKQIVKGRKKEGKSKNLGGASVTKTSVLLLIPNIVHLSPVPPN